jgi:hypothetical protein
VEFLKTPHASSGAPFCALTIRKRAQNAGRSRQKTALSGQWRVLLQAWKCIKGRLAGASTKGGSNGAVVRYGKVGMKGHSRWSITIMRLYRQRQRQYHRGTEPNVTGLGSVFTSHPSGQTLGVDPPAVTPPVIRNDTGTRFERRALLAPRGFPTFQVLLLRALEDFQHTLLTPSISPGGGTGRPLNTHPLPVLVKRLPRPGNEFSLVPS